jgi:hypothetical protein
VQWPRCIEPPRAVRENARNDIPGAFDNRWSV